MKFSVMLPKVSIYSPSIIGCILSAASLTVKLNMESYGNNESYIVSSVVVVSLYKEDDGQKYFSI